MPIKTTTLPSIPPFSFFETIPGITKALYDKAVTEGADQAKNQFLLAAKIEQGIGTLTPAQAKAVVDLYTLSSNGKYARATSLLAEYTKSNKYGMNNPDFGTSKSTLDPDFSKSPQEQYEIGMELLTARDTPSQEKAINLLAIAGHEGHAPAAFEFAKYSDRRSNYTAAVNFYQFAIDNLTAEPSIRAEAAYRLAHLYEQGKGVSENKAHAVKLLKFAADLGQGDAMYEYARYLEYGDKGIEANTEEAVKYYTLAIGKGNSSAIRHCAKILETTPAEVKARFAAEMKGLHPDSTPTVARSGKPTRRL